MPRFALIDSDKVLYYPFYRSPSSLRTMYHSELNKELRDLIIHSLLLYWIHRHAPITYTYTFKCTRLHSEAFHRASPANETNFHCHRGLSPLSAKSAVNSVTSTSLRAPVLLPVDHYSYVPQKKSKSIRRFACKINVNWIAEPNNNISISYFFFNYRNKCSQKYVFSGLNLCKKKYVV